MVGLRRIRHVLHLGLPPQRSQGNRAVVQRRTAADYQIATIGIGVLEVPRVLGV
jgi:hypothetical protein